MEACVSKTDKKKLNLQGKRDKLRELGIWVTESLQTPNVKNNRPRPLKAGKCSWKLCTNSRRWNYYSVICDLHKIWIKVQVLPFHTTSYSLQRNFNVSRIEANLKLTTLLPVLSTSQDESAQWSELWNVVDSGGTSESVTMSSNYCVKLLKSRLTLSLSNDDQWDVVESSGTSEWTLRTMISTRNCWSKMKHDGAAARPLIWMNW